jgi:hypothetical protein
VDGVVFLREPPLVVVRWPGIVNVGARAHASRSASNRRSDTAYQEK